MLIWLLAALRSPPKLWSNQSPLSLSVPANCPRQVATGRFLSAVSGIWRDRVIEEIARHDELLARQVDDGVARGVPATEEQDLHFAIAEIEPQFVLEDYVWHELHEPLHLCHDGCEAGEGLLQIRAHRVGQGLAVLVL
ncbi:MAG: hypothetical protein ACJ784_17940, partial [Myxococcales bacterium]